MCDVTRAAEDHRLSTRFAAMRADTRPIFCVPAISALRRGQMATDARIGSESTLMRRMSTETHKRNLMQPLYDGAKNGYCST